MSPSFRRWSYLFAATVVGVGVGEVARAQVNGTWTGGAGTSWWTDGANWTSNPQFPSGGGWATLTLGAPVTINQGITLSGITFDHLPGKLAWQNGTGSITLSGSAELRTLATGAVTAAEQRWREHAMDVFITGSNGFHKTGPATLRLTLNSSHTGGTTISGGMLQVRDNAGLGAAGAGVTFDGGTLRLDHATASFPDLSIARPIVLQPAGGTIDVGTYYNVRLQNPVSGAGDLTVVAQEGIVVLSGGSSHTGRTEVYGGGTAGFSGSLPFSSSIHAAGYYSLGSGGIGDNTPVSFRRAYVTYTSIAGPSEDRTGTITLAGGSTLLQMSAGTMASARLSAPALVRQNRATLSLDARSLGLPLAPGVTQVQLDNGTSLLVGGGGAAGSTSISIIPFIASYGEGTRTFVTYGPNGVRPLTNSEYASALPSGVSQQNVRLTQAATVNAPVTINSLALGFQTNLSGSATLSVSSGAILATDGSVTISNPINFGSAEGVINGPLTISGPISGAGGLTVGNAGFSGVTLSGASTYTGQTTLNEGTIRMGGNLMPGVPGPLGADTSPIVIGSGSGGSAPLVLTGVGSVTIGRDLVVSGDRRESYPPALRVNVSGDIDLQGPLVLEGGALLNGQISGPGRLVAQHAFTPSGARLTGNNTYSGGTELNGGSLTFSGSTAFGTGPIVVQLDHSVPRVSRLIHQGPATTINNPIVNQHHLVVASSGSLNIASSINLNSGIGTLGVDASELLLSGQIHNGTFATGTTGVLRITGNDNRQWGNRIGSGIIRVEADNALGRHPARTEVFGTLELVGDVSIPAHPLVLSSFSGDSLRSLSGTNRWNGTVSTGTSTVAIGVNAGVLSIGGDLNTGTFGTLTKAGAGVLELKNIRGTMTLNLSAGEVRVAPDGTDAGASKVRGVMLAGTPAAPTSRLDLANNALVIDYSSGTPISAVTSQLRAAFTSAGGPWTGNGITTSMGDDVNFGIGLAERSALTPPPTTFFGQTVDNTSLLLRFTRYGDANLDGVVNLQDFNRLASNFGQSNRFWHHGDFNYDGTVNLQDFNRLAINFGLSAGPDGVVDPEDWAALAAVVPEAGAGSAAAMLGLSTLLRRRRGRT